MNEQERELLNLLNRISDEDDYIAECEKEIKAFESKIAIRQLGINEAKNRIKEIRSVMRNNVLMPK